MTHSKVVRSLAEALCAGVLDALRQIAKVDVLELPLV